MPDQIPLSDEHLRLRVIIPSLKRLAKQHNDIAAYVLLETQARLMLLQEDEVAGVIAGLASAKLAQTVGMESRETWKKLIAAFDAIYIEESANLESSLVQDGEMEPGGDPKDVIRRKVEELQSRQERKQ